MAEKESSLQYDDFTSKLMLDEWPHETFFCVSISKDGKTSKKESKNYLELEKIAADSEISWVNCCVNDIEKEMPGISKKFGFKKELVHELFLHKTSAYLDMGTELGLLLPAMKVRNLQVNSSRIFVMIKNNLVLSVHSKKVTRWIRFFNYAETFMKKIPLEIPREDKITMIILRLLDKNDEKNFENLRIIEEEGDSINKLLIDSKSPRDKIGKEIYKMKHALISYLGVLWSSMDVLNSLRYGDSDLITDNPALLKEFSVLANELTSHISLTEHMSEVLASGLEVLQSIYNNQLQILNNRLALVVTWLTVLGTAVLVPNTLATIFGIPSISEHIGWMEVVTILVASTIISAGISYWAIKRVIPKKIE